MKKATKTMTQVYEQPDDEAARAKLLDGIKSLAAECKATWVAGSVHDETAYVETLEKELIEHVGEQGVENIRREFECQQLKENWMARLSQHLKKRRNNY